jgi:hypothetical protein
MRALVLSALILAATSCLGQIRIVVPFPSGGGADRAQSAADGKTLLMSSTASLTERNVRQFAAVTLVSASPYLVTASPRTNFSSSKT